MDYQLALAPDLHIDPVAFAADWNKTPDCRVVAQAAVKESPREGYLDPATVAVFLAGVAGSLAVDVLKEVVKSQVLKWIEAKQGPQPVTIQVIIIEKEEPPLLVVCRPD